MKYISPFTEKKMRKICSWVNLEFSAKRTREKLEKEKESLL